MANPCSPLPHPVRTLINQAALICRVMSLEFDDDNPAYAALLNAAREIEALPIPALPPEDGLQWRPVSEAVGDGQPRWITDGTSVGIGGQIRTGDWFVAVLFKGAGFQRERVTHYAPIAIPNPPLPQKL